MGEFDHLNKLSNYTIKELHDEIRKRNDEYLKERKEREKRFREYLKLKQEFESEHTDEES